MPGFYFDDVLRTTNGHLDKDLWRPAPKWTLFDISAKCQARDNFAISHKRQWQNEWKEKEKGKGEVECHLEKSQTDFAWSKDGIKYGFGLVSDAMKANVAGKLTEGDWKCDGKAEAEWKHGKGEWKGKGILNVSSPVMAEKLKMWFNAELEHNHKTEWNTLLKMNLNYDQWHVGFGGENKAGDWDKQHAQVVYNDKSRQYFVRADLKDTVVGIGCSLDKDDFSHSYEVEADMKEGAVGVAGTPLVINGGGEYELNKKCNIGYTFVLGQHFSYNQAIEHKVDKNWTVTLSQSFDAECLEKDRKKPAYDVGVAFQYKL